MTNRIWVDEESRVLVNLWPDGTCTVATREARGAVWGPPTYLLEETLPEPRTGDNQPDDVVGSPGAKEEGT